MNKLGIVNIAVILFNPWWWVAFQRDLVIGILALLVSLLVALYFFQGRMGKLLILFSAVFVSISIITALDSTIWTTSELEIQQYGRRHEFYAKGLGKLYTNRFTLSYFKKYHLPLTKLQGNFFANLDPNLYFFSSHPRERGGIEEFNKYLPIFLPFFIIGFLYLIYNPKTKLIIYIAAILLLSSFISPNFKLGPILVLPIINYLITLGLLLSIKILGIKNE